MDRRTWLIRTGAGLLGAACAPLERLSDWHAWWAAPKHPPIINVSKQTLFVNSAVRGVGGPGTSWETAFASLQDAMDTITAPGTTILIASDHREPLSNSIVTSEHGVQMIGFADVSKRPCFNMKS